MKMKTAAVVAAVVIVGMAFGASAFTTATIERDSTIDVTSDSNSIIALSAGSSSMVSETDGELTIDMSGSNGEGVNVNSTYVIGDTSNATNTYAFSTTNNDANARNITFAYAANTDNDANKNVQFDVYDSGGSSATSFSEEGNATLTSVSSGTTHYIVLTVDTSGSATNDDLSGTLTVTAE